MWLFEPIMPYFKDFISGPSWEWKQTGEPIKEKTFKELREEEWYAKEADCNNCSGGALVWIRKGTLIANYDISQVECPWCACKKLKFRKSK